MVISRTTGSASVVPELVYPDVGQAVDWLCETFGFTELWRVGGHRARVAFGNGTVIIADADAGRGRAVPDGNLPRTHGVMVKVDDVDDHHDHALRRGARIVSPPTDYPYGERQYSVEDLAGQRWTFTQALETLHRKTGAGHQPRRAITPRRSHGGVEAACTRNLLDGLEEAGAQRRIPVGARRLRRSARRPCRRGR